MSDMGEIPDEPVGRTTPCPHCGGDMRPIAWGYPLMDDPLLQAARRDEVYLGGCVIPEGPIPQWHCFRCGRDVHLPEADLEA